jgi:hypothetical protein
MRSSPLKAITGRFWALASESSSDEESNGGRADAYFVRSPSMPLSALCRTSSPDPARSFPSVSGDKVVLLRC